MAIPVDAWVEIAYPNGYGERKAAKAVASWNEMHLRVTKGQARCMGYHNPDLPHALNLFAGNSEPIAWSNERLHKRFRVGNGLPLFRAEQLDEAYDDLFDEPLLRLEYDRFLPENPPRSAD